jgi:chemotaxis protein CheZ
MTQHSSIADWRREQALALLAALDRGDEPASERILDVMSHLRETALFLEVGRLTRQLHDTLANFAVDGKLADLTAKDIPDAKERLGYVISMTEQAANTTLNVVENLFPLLDRLAEVNRDLHARWRRFRQREMPFEEFKAFSAELEAHFERSRDDVHALQSGLNEVLMAQGFQDITGQIIRRVIHLVQEVEVGMVEMIRVSGTRFRTLSESREQAESSGVQGPAVPGLDSGTASNQDEVDALLSSMGF